jgi:predicted HicB family RNase H-like nuclease
MLVSTTVHYKMPGPPRQKTALLNARIESDLKKAAMAAAKDERRSLTSLIENVLEQYLTERGYLPSKAAGKRR